MRVELQTVQIVCNISIRLFLMLLTSWSAVADQLSPSNDVDSETTYNLNYAGDGQHRKHLQNIIIAMKGLGIVGSDECYRLDHITKTSRHNNGSRVDITFYLDEQAHGKGRPDDGNQVHGDQQNSTQIEETVLKCINGLLVAEKKRSPKEDDVHIERPLGEYLIFMYSQSA